MSFKLEMALYHIKSKSPKKRLKGYQILEKYKEDTVDSHDLIRFLKEAKTIKVENPYDTWDDPSYHLTNFVSKYHSQELYEEAVQNFSSYSVMAKGIVLDLLLMIDTDESIQKYVDFSCSYMNDIPYLRFETFHKTARYSSILFPSLFKLLEHQNFRYGILQLFFIHVLEGWTDRSLIRDHKESVMDEFEYLHTSLLPYQESFEDKALYVTYKDDYMDHRYPFNLILHMLSYINDKETNRKLKQVCLTFKDKLILAVACCGLLENNQKIGKKLQNCIARNDESRNYFYEQLRRLDRLNLFPEEFKTQEHLAKSQLITWLTQPDNLGHFPSDTKLIDVYTETLNGEDYEFYLFKFRSTVYEWKEKGWMIAVSGGYKKSEKPTVESTGNTYSQFATYQKDQVDEHFLALLDTVEKANRDYNEEVVYEFKSPYSFRLAFIGLAWFNSFWIFPSLFSEQRALMVPVTLGIVGLYALHARKINRTRVRITRSSIVFISSKKEEIIPLTRVQSFKKEKRNVKGSKRLDLLKPKEIGFVLLDEEKNEIGFIPERLLSEEILHQTTRHNIPMKQE
ncbi:hypothetical protein IMZ31_22770 (plasmid) [Pontibacillus sp. ALD_SL1]|uniref:hypothetical protein n=1 Tax=Pontibacillus sp. ALD_SL1 TaxID=2777185 RepID=UPI001A95E0A6|nr:hypothetical protein [Pontibacillus sp. ALD_SL1]QST02280.1 hypothetical protein IMZ31_22770 [Pontibacillus sp. ALD_SL1]